MNKKKMILTSLASAAVLGAGFVASQPFVVNAYDNTSTTEEGRNQENALADASEKEYKKLADEKAKKDLFDGLDKVEKELINSLIRLIKAKNSQKKKINLLAR